MKHQPISFSTVLCVGAIALVASYAAPASGQNPTGSGYPTVASISPAKVAAGAAGFSLTVNGTGFVATTAVQVGGVIEPTTFVSSTQVKAAVSAQQIETGGYLPVIALNGDNTSASGARVNLEVDNPLPAISLFVPSYLPVGTPATAVPAIGSGYTPSTVLKASGSARTTIYYSPSQVDVLFTAADLATAGNLSVTAVNAAPGGGASAPVSFMVGTPAPTPVIYTVTPNQFYTSAANSSITVNGWNLTSSSFVQWNGFALATTTFGSGYNGQFITAVVPAKFLAKTGSASITVNSPTASPSTSNAITVSIVTPPAPTLTSVSPGAGPINTASTVTLYGANFTSSSVASYNGTPLPTTYVSPTALTVALSATSISLPGNGNFTVATPAPGGGVSAPVVYTAYIAIANNSMVYNPANGLFYVSVPSTAGAPYGNSVVSVDPATGALGTPIFVGSEPDQLALSSDGTILWVGLDDASAVRQVNLKTGTAGLQFTLGGNGGLYQAPATALALAALPGAPNSVVVSTIPGNGSSALAIYDSGVIRGKASGGYATPTAYALQTNGTLGEIYAASQAAYSVYTYSASGLALKTSKTTGTYASNRGSDIQVAGGRLYTDYGTVFDAESGSLLGTFYSSGTNAATGPAVADTTLGRAFVLEGQGYPYSGPTQIAAFDPATFNLATTAVAPVNFVSGSGYNQPFSPSRLTRWGTNGLAFRTSAGVFTLRTNVVKDLSKVNADLGVALAVSGAAATGATTTYTATVTNAGPSGATNIALAALIPANGVLVSATPSAGTCSAAGSVACNLGGLAKGGKITVAFQVKQLAPGNATLTAQVSGSETDPNLANNQATATAKIAGAAWNPAPVAVSVSPAVIKAGSGDTEITVTGSGFSSGSSILLNGAKLATTVVSATQLTAMAPRANLASLGWSAVSVSNPAPGGGVSNSLPLTVFSVVTLGVNHILYDPYSTRIMASVGAGSASVTGNSIVAITPGTGAVGAPVAIGSQPTSIALTSDGQILYTVLSGSQSVARFNMLTGKAEYSWVVPPDSQAGGQQNVRGIAAQPGTENTIALDLGSWAGNAIYDFNPAAKTAAIRGAASGPYSGSCIKFLDAGDMLAFDTDTSGSTLDHYTVTAKGFQYYNYSQYSESTLLNFGCFQLSGGLAFANGGGVANPAPSTAMQLGVFQGVTGGGFSTTQDVAPDASLGRVFFLSTPGYSNAQNALLAYNLANFLPAMNLPLDMESTEGNTTYRILDFIRWGQDGLAALTDGGHIYLLRGPVVTPQLLNKNTAATLTASSASTLTHGAGNTMLTLTGGNFVPGVAVTWNGSYRTTAIADATHLTVAIPASDLAAVGTGTLVAVNPGAGPSASLKVTVK